MAERVELGEQVRRLIQLQTKVQVATVQLPKEAKARQDSLTLKAVEDQRDVKELFLQFVETLTVKLMTYALGLRRHRAPDPGDRGLGPGHVQLEHLHRLPYTVVHGVERVH